MFIDRRRILKPWLYWTNHIFTNSTQNPTKFVWSLRFFFALSFFVCASFKASFHVVQISIIDRKTYDACGHVWNKIDLKFKEY